MWKIAIDVRKINDYGIGTYVANLLYHLPIEEKKIHYFLFGERSKKEAELFNRPDFTFLAEDTPKYSLREMRNIPRLLRKLKIDLYHSPHYALPLKKVCPSVVTIHDIIHLLFPHFLPSRRAFLYAKVMMRNAVLNSDSIICVSKNTREDLIKRYENLPKDKISTIYNGVKDHFVPVEDRIDYDFNRYILYVGNLKPHKNLITLFKAFSILKNRMKRKEKLVIVGGLPNEYPELVKEAKRNRVFRSIIWYSDKNNEEMLALYQNASVFAFPSLYEGFGLPPLEAMACGIPVVASSSSSLPEIVDNAGLLVEPMYTEGWAKALLNILTNEHLEKNLRKKGVIQAKKFSWRDAAEKTRDLYLKVLTAKK